jgi:hypothetical protein
MSYLTEDAIMVAIQMGAVTWTLRSPDSSDWQEWNSRHVSLGKRRIENERAWRSIIHKQWVWCKTTSDDDISKPECGVVKLTERGLGEWQTQ